MTTEERLECWKLPLHWTSFNVANNIQTVVSLAFNSIAEGLDSSLVIDLVKDYLECLEASRDIYFFTLSYNDHLRLMTMEITFQYEQLVPELGMNKRKKTLELDFGKSIHEGVTFIDGENRKSIDVFNVQFRVMDQLMFYIASSPWSVKS